MSGFPSTPAPGAPSRAVPSGSVKQLFQTALLLRIIVAVFLHVATPEGLFAPDEETYRTRAQTVATVWASEFGPPARYFLPEGPVAYYYITAALFFLFGPLPLVPKLLNCLVGAVSVPLLFDVTVRLGGSPTAALRAARYAVWFPSLVLWSALNIRDSWIVLLILLIVRQALVLQERARPLALLGLGLGLLALIQFRDYILLPVAAPVVVSFLVHRSRSPLRNLVLGAVASVLLIYADQAAGSNRKLRVLDLEEFQQRREWNTMDAASRFEQADISTPTKALVFLPKGLAYFLLAPFPWMLGSIRQVLAVPETLFFYWLLPRVLKGIRYLLRQHFRESLMAVLITGGLTLGYALGEGNAGTAYRHRAQIVGFFLAFGAIGLDPRAELRLSGRGEAR